MEIIDLSHTIEDGMVTYPGLAVPSITDHWTREDSAAHYAPGTSFQMGRIDMVANTGTYLDVPFHRYGGGYDLAELELWRVSAVEAVAIDATQHASVGLDLFEGIELENKAVLVATGWDRHWRTGMYGEPGHPHLTNDAATFLRDSSVALVGIDSVNIDDTRGMARPVHSILLEAGIPIVEHLTHLTELAPSGFRFTAVPPKVRGMGSFPVRAHATVGN